MNKKKQKLNKNNQKLIILRCAIPQKCLVSSFLPSYNINKGGEFELSMLLCSAISPRWRSRGVGNSNSLDLTGKKHRAFARLIKKHSLRSLVFLIMGVSLPTPITPLGYLINKNGEAVQAGMPMTVTKMG